MYGENRIRELLRAALAASSADQTEAVIQTEDSSLTRFANSAIHQNVAERNASLTVRAVLGRKIGSARTNVLDPAEIRRTVRLACEAARVQPENPKFHSLPGPSAPPRAIAGLCVPATASFTARQRAEAVKVVCGLATRHGARAYGALSTGTAEYGVANSLGVACYAQASDADINTIVMTGTGSGYAQAAARDVRDIDFRRLAGRAVRKAVDSQHPVELGPGRYDVVLEHPAVDELLGFVSGGFSALAVQEQRSFLCGKIGKRVFSPAVTICDDAYDRRGFAFPFDLEGVPKQRVPLVVGGIARGVVHNSYTANIEKTRSTGHALNEYGNSPAADNVVMKGGDSSLAKMIGSTGRGIYVTRFNYCNIIDQMSAEVTGMTRDGTFLIEKGRITRPVRNLRFTESVVRALARVDAVSREVRLITSGGGYGRRFAVGSLVPALKIKGFNFTGVTEF
jgi:predicted Zn-dependent protease